MKRATKTDPVIRKRQILQDAMHLAERVGHKNLTRDSVALAAEVSGPLVAKYFKTMARLKQTVFKEAVKQKIFPILAHCVAELTTAQLRTETLNYISTKR